MQPDILVAFDFSPASERALAWAGELHRQLGGRLHAVHVLDPIPMSDAILPYPVPVVTEGQVAELAAALQERITALGLDGTSEVLLASGTGPALLSTAQAWGATLLVMGTHGRGGMARLVLGSVAEHVVRHADCPVVTMHATS